MSKREASLKSVVIDNIGKPKDLLKIDIKQLWDVNHYRVNIWRSIDGDIKITDSYFVECSENYGEIEVSPPFERKY